MTKSSGITTNVILTILEEQDFKCALSGIPLTPGTAQLDHIVPTRRGGEHVPENVQVLFEDVNRAKSAMLEAEFVDLCRKVVEHADLQSK
jgi:5-methylcytosine-specific restriction endonuclease McrA